MRTIRIIAALVGKQLRILWRMPAILLVIFLPGIVMYAVFTKIFEGSASGGGGSGITFKLGVLDLDDSPASRSLVAALADADVRVRRIDPTTMPVDQTPDAFAGKWVLAKGNADSALIIPQGFFASPVFFMGDSHEGVRLVYDEASPIQASAIEGLLQMAAGRALFDGLKGLVTGGFANPISEEDAPPSSDSADAAPTTENDAVAAAPEGDEQSRKEPPAALLRVTKVGAAEDKMPIAAKHLFLAGIVPMFLLFGASGAARGIIDELHSGEIARLMVAPVASGQILIGSLIPAMLVAVLQCYSMYLFAWLVFGVAIWNITAGLFVLTVATAAATTGFGIFLGALCRTAQQVDSIGTIVILAMSAIGGSMVPRFIMPEFMKKLGLFTINGWSYDGFLALIRGEGLTGIAAPLAVLLVTAAVLMTLGTHLLARRLEAGPAA